MNGKPRIKRRHSILSKEWVWECCGRGRMGTGTTPHAAFYEWRWHVDFDTRCATARARTQEQP